MHKIARTFTLDADLVSQIDIRPDLRGKLSGIVNDALRSLVLPDDSTVIELRAEIETLEKQLDEVSKKLVTKKAKLSRLESEKEYERHFKQDFEVGSGANKDMWEGAGL
jgi:hypothetical protein